MENHFCGDLTGILSVLIQPPPQRLPCVPILPIVILNRELWCISSSLKVDKLINVGQDLAVAIKSPSEVALKSYQHIYKKPGTYKVTFQAANSNIYDRKELVKEIEITV